MTEGFEDSTLPSTWTTIDDDGDGNNWYRESMKAKTGNGHAASASAIQTPQDDLIPLSPNNYLITPDITIPTDISAILTFWYSGFYYRSQEHFLVKVGNAGASSVGDFNTQVFEETTSAEYEQANFDLSSYAGQTIRLAFIHNNTYDKYQLCIDDIVVGEAGAGATIVSDITGNSAICGGYVSNDGGAPVTARGVCWSTSPNPTVNDSHTTDGSGTGSFTSNITGLSATTTYYVRAYAINSADTSYGNQVSFTTTEALPEVTTSAVSNITATTATCGGNVTDQGVSAVTARGVCWSTSENPTVSNSHTTDGSGMYSFTSNITGLSSGTTYYVRAYATNSAGTAYGNQVSFTLPVIDTKSCPEASTVTDHEGNVYATVQIGTLCWMRENLRTTTSPKTGTYLVNKSGKCSSDPVWVNTFSFMGSKVARWPNSDSTTSVTKGYGLLYNWCAAMDTANPTNYVEVPTSSNTNGNDMVFSVSVTGNYRGICPAGWHLPSHDEFTRLDTSNTLSNLLADGDVWSGSPDNASGFTALPARYFGNCTFYSSDAASFWGCTTNSQNEAKAKSLYMTASQENDGYTEKNYCLSVRCVRDAVSVSTEAATGIGQTSATLNGSIVNLDNVSITNQGFEWKATGGSYTQVSASVTTPGYELSGLQPNTSYTFRTFATTSAYGTFYGAEQSFTTEAEQYAATTAPATDIAYTSATLNGSVVNDDPDNLTITEQGFEWKATSDVSYTRVTLPIGTSMSHTLDVLTPNTDYTFRAFASTSNSTVYGADITFTTLSVPTGITVTTSTATNIEYNSTTLNGSFTNLNDFPITGKGFEWKAAEGGSYTPVSVTGSTFSCSLAGLAVNRAYIYRAFVTTSQGTIYGDPQNFTTSQKTYCPNVTSRSNEMQYSTGYSTGIDSLIDVDGNRYAVVQIGTQCWMAQNLRTEHYSNGDTIKMEDNMSLPYKPYRCYPNGDAANVPTYGYLYNWTAMLGTSSASDMNEGSIGGQGVCPTGWHVPSEGELKVLFNYVKGQNEYLCGGGNDTIAKALASTTGWAHPSTAPSDNKPPYDCKVGHQPEYNNATGFNALPAGQFMGFADADLYCQRYVQYNYYSQWSILWTASLKNAKPHYYAIDFNRKDVFPLDLGGYNSYDGCYADYALSVRCVRDSD